MTRLPSSSSMRMSFVASSSSIRETGIPVHFDTTSAMSCSVISSRRIRRDDWSFLSFFTLVSSSFSSAGIRPYRISAAFERSARTSALSASWRSFSRSFFIVFISESASFSPFHFTSSSRVRSFSSAISFSIALIRAFCVLCSSLLSESISLRNASRSISSRMIRR